MSDPVALVTNACHFAGPPAVVALREAGFRVVAGTTDVTARDAWLTASLLAAAYLASLPVSIVAFGREKSQPAAEH